MLILRTRFVVVTIVLLAGVLLILLLEPSTPYDEEVRQPGMNQAIPTYPYRSFSCNFADLGISRYNGVIYPTCTLSTPCYYPLIIGTDTEKLESIINNTAQHFDAKYLSNCTVVSLTSEPVLGAALGVLEVGFTQNYSEFANVSMRYPSTNLVAYKVIDRSSNTTFWMASKGPLSQTSQEQIEFVQFVQLSLNSSTN